MKVRNFDAAKEEIRLHLSEYLHEQGIQKQSSFHCLSPKHPDSSPSSGVLPDNTHFHCLGCNFTGDIFDACHFLEGRPATGPGFITENLSYLAAKYGVNLELEELSPEEAHELDCYRIYSKAADFLFNGFAESLTQDKSRTIRAELKRRGWDKVSDVGTFKKLGFGWTRSVHLLVEALEASGFSRDFIHEMELDKPDLFGPNSLIFTITDHFGRPVGFAARNTAWREGSADPKYFNTSSGVGIYQKGKRFYNLHNALKFTQEGQPLYIMEGYPNVVTAVMNGFQNCCAIGGTALTEDHVLLLRDRGVSTVVLCLDGDKAGQENTQRLLDERFAGYQDLTVKVVVVPDEKDPDEFIHDEGIDSFKKLAQFTGFEWRLLRFPESTDQETICKIMIPLIVGEASYITQEKLCNILAKHTGISLKTILAELNRLQSEKERKIARERTVILDRLSRTIDVSPGEAEIALQESLHELQSLSERYNQDKLSPETFLKLLEEEKHAQENKSGEFAGFRLGPDLSTLEEALSGDWKKDVLKVFGGKANSGKTSLLAKMGYEIARHEENDALVIFHSIDDTAAQFLPKWVCIAEGSRKLTINEVRDPVYYEKVKGIPDVFNRRSIGYQAIRNLVKANRLVLKDANDGNTLAYTDSVIRYYKERFPNRRIVYFLDNMHKLQEFGNASADERIKFRSISERLKNIATRHHVTVIATVEYTKLGQGVKPTNTNIAETVQIEYDSNFIAHLYNEAHEFGEEEAEKKGMTHNYQIHNSVRRLPVIELIIGKNKISDFKNRLFFNFYPASSDFTARNTGEVEQMIEDKKKQSSEQPKGYKKTSFFTNPN